MEKKPFWKSMTIWGTFVTGIGVVLPLVGIEFGAEQQADTLKVIGLALDGVGIVATIVGRLRAKTAVGVTAAPAVP